MDPGTTFEDRGTYLRCDFGGPFALQPLLDLMHEIRAYCVAHGHRRILVDLRTSQGTLGALERYEHAVEIAKSSNLGVRTAIVVRPDQIFSDRFWETVTRNRGRMTHVGTDPDEALAWLAADPR
jgi:hypothetical protein